MPGLAKRHYPVWHVFRAGRPEELYPMGNPYFSVVDIVSRITDSEG